MSKLTNDLEAWLMGVKPEKEIRVMQRRIGGLELALSKQRKEYEALLIDVDDMIKRLASAEAALHIIRFVINQTEPTLEEKLT